MASYQFSIQFENSGPLQAAGTLALDSSNLNPPQPTLSITYTNLAPNAQGQDHTFNLTGPDPAGVYSVTRSLTHQWVVYNQPPFQRINLNYNPGAISRPLWGTLGRLSGELDLQWQASSDSRP